MIEFVTWQPGRWVGWGRAAFHPPDCPGKSIDVQTKYKPKSARKTKISLKNLNRAVTKYWNICFIRFWVTRISMCKLVVVVLQPKTVTGRTSVLRTWAHLLASCRMEEWASGSKGFSKQANKAYSQQPCSGRKWKGNWWLIQNKKSINVGNDHCSKVIFLCCEVSSQKITMYLFFPLQNSSNLKSLT